MAPSSSMAAPDSRYHHFVPQFLLRSFSHPYTPAPGSKKRSNSNPKSKKNDRIFPGDMVLNGIDISGSIVKIVETKVSKTFGVQDMYLDVTHSTNKQHIEEMFSKLELKAAVIVSKVKKCFESGEKEVRLMRTEKDTIRKFLFIQRYRRPKTRERFGGNAAGDYNGGDKHQFMEYMRERGFKKPIEVWLDNIKAMLEIKMDITTDWKNELRQKCYPLDADWFVLHTGSSYMAFCTPSDPSDEFLMTENGYGIHEGPVSNVANVETGEILSSSYTEYHMFAHISPRLTIVLRSMLLPLAAEDGNVEVRNFRERFLDFTKKFHHDPKTAVSFLEDLPVTKALNSYSQIVNGQYSRITGQGPVLSSKDSFRFRFFPLSFEHVSKINIIFLEEAYETSIIAFNNKTSVRRALEYYSSFEEDDATRNFKLTNGRDDCPRLIYLKKLEQAMKLLGGDVEAIYKTRSLDEIRVRYTDDPVYNMIAGSAKLLEIYTIMSKKFQLDRTDFQQAKIMLLLRIKIDTWTKGLDESFREQVRNNLRDFYCQLPMHRLWIYLKRVRIMFRGGTIINFLGRLQDGELKQELLFGPEDAIAKVHDVFLPGHAKRTMSFAGDNYLQIHNPDFGLKEEVSSEDEAILSLRQEISLTFGPQGSICDCGIPDVQEAAKFQRASFVKHRADILADTSDSLKVVLTPEQLMEAAIRGSLKVELYKLGPDDGLKALFDILLDVVYPLFMKGPS